MPAPHDDFNRTKSLAQGDRLGVYEILEPTGTGRVGALNRTRDMHVSAISLSKSYPRSSQKTNDASRG